MSFISSAAIASNFTAGLFPSPISQPDAWDQIVVASLTWVGKIDVQKAGRSYKWDKKEGPGLEGDQHTYLGKTFREFDIVFYLWTDAHFSFWPLFSQQFQYNGLKLGATSVQPVQVKYPSLALLGINQILCRDLGAVEPVGEDKLYRSIVRVQEFGPPIPQSAKVTPVAAKVVPPTTGVGYQPNPVIKELQDRIVPLQKQAGALGLPGGLP